MLETVDTVLRLLIIGQLSMLGAVMGLRERPWLAAASSLLVLSMVGYIVASSAVLASALVFLDPLLVGFAIAVPYLLWWFAAIVFEFARPHPGWLILPVVALGNWLTYLHPGDSGSYDGIVSIAARIASLVVVVHVLYVVLVGRRDDLLEARRRFRSLFVGLLSSFMFSTVIVELYLMGPAPMWLQFTSAILIEVFTLGLGIPLVLAGEWFASERAGTRPARSAAPNERLRAALVAAMGNRAYAEHGLAIADLADRVGAPEHELRRLINQSLGYRNFSAFVNSYRIQEAAERLRDPDQARLPILSIALDVGFGSIGPFNRAFKHAMNITPSAYRGGATPAIAQISRKP